MHLYTGSLGILWRREGRHGEGEGGGLDGEEGGGAICRSSICGHFVITVL